MARAPAGLARSLPKANLLLTPRRYRVVAWRATAIAFALAAFASAAAARMVGAWLAWAVVPFLAAAATAGVAFAVPRMRASARASALDSDLAASLNHILAVAQGGVPLDQVLARLADQRQYGEVAVEAARIRRDQELLGMDLTTALQAARARSPSLRFHEFLQGLETTATAGQSLASFLQARRDEAVQLERIEQDARLDSVALMAEVFVVVAVATPLLLLIFLSVMMTFGRSADEVLRLGYVLAIALLPALYALFAATVRLVAPVK